MKLDNNWPRYIRFENRGLIIFNNDVPGSFLEQNVKDQIVDSGRVEVNKWMCYNDDGELNYESTNLLRKSLSV